MFSSSPKWGQIRLAQRLPAVTPPASTRRSTAKSAIARPDLLKAEQAFRQAGARNVKAQ
jgi:hypothetical protein